MLGEFPSILIVAYIVNIKFLGRKNSWSISYFLCGITGIIIILEVPTFIVWVTLAKLAISMSFTLAYEYTGEIYPTKHRAKGLGMAGSFSRIGGILMPWYNIMLIMFSIFLIIFLLSSNI